MIYIYNDINNKGILNINGRKLILPEDTDFLKIQKNLYKIFAMDKEHHQVSNNLVCTWNCYQFSILVSKYNRIIIIIHT